MDNLRGFEEEAGYALAADDEPVMERPPEIGLDERRMHVRAYNHWVSLLKGRPYPSISDLEPQRLTDFGPNSVLLDFTKRAEDPAIAYIGRELREECGLASDIRTIADVPSRSLISRLTDHYLQIIANRAPIGFEAEFVGQRGLSTMYRGILMPFSATGETIDFIYGVINWKELVDSATAVELGREVDRALAAAPAVEASPIWADGPNAEPLDADEAAPQEDVDQPELGLEAGLADRLHAARMAAEALDGADVRSRAALYRALGQAYDFALSAEAEPEDYAELLEDSGLKAQARAPMTPVVKLVFGVKYDKTRLTEFAAALSWGRRQGLAAGGLGAYLDRYEGGLKAVVQAERRARRPEPKPDPYEALREALRVKPPIGWLDVDAGEGEFVLLIARRDETRGVSVLTPVPEDKALIERAIRKAAA
jgi:hypothetical protein